MPPRHNVITPFEEKGLPGADPGEEAVHHKAERATPVSSLPPPLRIAEGDVEALADAIAGRVVERLAARAEAADRLLTVEGVAGRLNVSKRTVEALVAEGALVPVRVRSARRFTQEAVDVYLRRIASQPRRRKRA